MRPSAVLVVLQILLISCNTTEAPPPHVSSIQLSVEDVSCTEAWLKITLTDSNQPRTIALRRDGQTVLTAQLTANDSILIDEALLPNHAYLYQLQRLASDSSVIETSVPVQLTTMDTTSHVFTWHLDTLGDGASSILYDVALVNDSLAFAVGELYLRDSTGGYEYPPYNAAKWNGGEWELFRIQFYTFCGQPSTSSYPARCVAITSSPLLMIGSNASQVAVWDANSQESITCIPGTSDRMWAEGADRVYVVGQVGKISLWNGSEWSSINSHTSTDIQDVYGGYNRLLGAHSVLLPVSFKYTYGEEKLLLVREGTQLDSLPYPRQNAALHSVWFDRNSQIYACGNGLFSFNGRTWKEITALPRIFMNRIRGNASNDVFVVGDRGFVAHFNGVSWHTFEDVTLPYGAFESLSTKSNSIVAVGTIAGSYKAAVLRGIR